MTDERTEGLTAPRRLCAGSGKDAAEQPGNVYPHCPDCGRAFSCAGTRASKNSARRGNPWKTGIPRHYVR
jgi:hypothetical protein